MLTPSQILDAYFLDTRHMLLEIAAFFDRYDAAIGRSQFAANDERRVLLQNAVGVLAGQSSADRTEIMLDLFSEK